MWLEEQIVELMASIRLTGDEAVAIELEDGPPAFTANILAGAAAGKPPSTKANSIGLTHTLEGEQ